jgi:predicted lysophospholipase L1 biosynthesis ABC-type transport system permease subunit
MKALGATKRDIGVQYLLEAGILGVVSSLIGIAIGMIVSFAIGALSCLRSAMTSQSIVKGLLFEALATIMADVYPANKAAKLDSIEVFGQNSPMEGNNWRDLTQDQKEDIERIRNGGEALLAIINDILEDSQNVSKKLSGKCMIFFSLCRLVGNFKLS